MFRGKKYQTVAKLVDSKKVYTVEEAADLLKQTSITKFDANVQVSFSLNVDPKKQDQQLRGTLSLPHGNGKTKTVLAITHKVEEALAAGADFAGDKEILEKIKTENWFGFDVIVATPDMMGELGKMGKILGPKGLMPNPKTGTVSPDIAKAVKEIKAGKMEYRVDKDGNMALSIAKVSFEKEKIAENLQYVINTIVKIKPASVKGQYVLNAVVHTTMGPSIKIAVNC